MKELVERLVIAREAKKISLQDISYKTNIRLEILTRLEHGDVNFQPAPYIRAMLSKYAEVVGERIEKSDIEFESKPEPSVELQSQTPQHPLPTSIQQPEKTPSQVLLSPEDPNQIRNPLVYAGLATFFLIIAFGIWYVSSSELFLHTSAAETNTQLKPHTQPKAKQNFSKEAAIDTTPEESNTTLSSPSLYSDNIRKPIIEPISETNTEKGIINDKKHTLIVRSKTDTCWISVASDKNTAKQILLVPSASARFNADSLFVLNVGKSETAEVWLNGKLITLPKRSGSISGLRLTFPKD